MFEEPNAVATRLVRPEASRGPGVLRLVLRTQPRAKKFARPTKPFRQSSTNEHDLEGRMDRPVLLHVKISG